MELKLLLGTNLGDREANLQKAESLLKTSLEGSLVGSTPAIRTEAVGFDGPDFLNMILVFETSMEPADVLHACKRVETEMGRREIPEYDPQGRRIYHSRIIDIDILTYDPITMDTPELKIPHPQVEERAFVAELLSML